MERGYHHICIHSRICDMGIIKMVSLTQQQPQHFSSMVNLFIAYWTVGTIGCIASLRLLLVASFRNELAFSLFTGTQLLIVIIDAT